MGEKIKKGIVRYFGYFGFFQAGSVAMRESTYFSASFLEVILIPIPESIAFPSSERANLSNPSRASFFVLWVPPGLQQWMHHSFLGLFPP